MESRKPYLRQDAEQTVPSPDEGSPGCGCARNPIIAAGDGGRGEGQLTGGTRERQNRTPPSSKPWPLRPLLLAKTDGSTA